MKKMPTLFERTFANHKVVETLPNIVPGFEWVLEGEGDATIKWDGTCCAFIDGIFYKRYDAKRNKKTGEYKLPPANAIPCDAPDPITGHWPHWVPVDENNPDDKWFIEAKNKYEWAFGIHQIPDGTYEAIGKHFNSNPYNMEYDILQRHGVPVIYNLRGIRTYDTIKTFLQKHQIEGIVFWKDGSPQCKIKRSDFGFEWPIKDYSMTNELNDMAKEPRDSLLSKTFVLPE